MLRDRRGRRRDRRPAADLDDRQSGAPGRRDRPTRLDQPSRLMGVAQRAPPFDAPRRRRRGGRTQEARTGRRRRPRRRGCAGSMPRARRLQPAGVGRRRRDRPGRRAVRPSPGALPRWPLVSTARGPSPLGCSEDVERDEDAHLADCGILLTRHDPRTSVRATFGEPSSGSAHRRGDQRRFVVDVEHVADALEGRDGTRLSGAAPRAFVGHG